MSFVFFIANKGNNKITELRTILQRESQNSQASEHIQLTIGQVPTDTNYSYSLYQQVLVFPQL